MSSTAYLASSRLGDKPHAIVTVQAELEESQTRSASNFPALPYSSFLLRAVRRIITTETTRAPPSASCRRVDGVGAPNGGLGLGEGVEVALEGTVFVRVTRVGVGAVPLPREMGLATADTRMQRATTRRKAALATKTPRAREDITADGGLRERLDMRASFLPYTNRHSGVWPWYTISDTIIQTRHAHNWLRGQGYAHTDNLPGENHAGVPKEATAVYSARSVTRKDNIVDAVFDLAPAWTVNCKDLRCGRTGDGVRGFLRPGHDVVSFVPNDENNAAARRRYAQSDRRRMTRLHPLRGTSLSTLALLVQFLTRGGAAGELSGMFALTSS